MKRSEMVKKLHKELLYYIDTDKIEFTELNANDVLFVIEQLGMLPPKYDQRQESVFGNNNYLQINEWEPENG